MQVEDRLRLPPTPGSAGQARAFLTAGLAEMGLEALVETARLAVSELVTNVILHAGTDMEVTLRRTDRGVRVDVWDASPLLPAVRHYGAQATTGRGLSMVAVLVAGMGVEAEPPHGKRVWFSLDAPASGTAMARQDAEPSLEAVGELLAGDWDLDQLLAELAPGEMEAWDTAAAAPTDATAGEATRQSVPATLHGLPVRLWRATQRHHDAALRELGYLRRVHKPPDDDVDADVRVARQAQSLLAAAVDAAVLAAQAPGRPAGAQHASVALRAAVDVPLHVPPGPLPITEMYATLQNLLDEAEALAVQGRLLVRPALPEVVGLRDWCCEQVIAQSRGVPAVPWSYPTAELDPVAAEPLPGAAPSFDIPGWDEAEVRESPRCVVAADDRNRLIAVSSAAAALLGWRAEELVGRRIVTMVPHRLREAHVAGFTAHLATGEVTLLGTPTELPVLRADGTELRCRVLIEEVTGEPVEPVGSRVYVAWMDPLP